MLIQVKRGVNSKTTSALESVKTSCKKCDFYIKVKEKYFKVHKSVLGASSPYFNTVISSNTGEVQWGFITVSNLCPKVVERCLDAIYDGEVDLTIENVSETIDAALRMRLHEVRDTCIEFLKISLSVDNCLQIIEIASFHELGEVNEHAKDLGAKNFAEIIEKTTFSSLSITNLIDLMMWSNENAIVCWKATEKWISASHKRQKGPLSGLLRVSKIESLSYEEFSEHVLRKPALRFRPVFQKVFMHWMSVCSPQQAFGRLTLHNFYSIYEFHHSQPVPETMKKAMIDFFCQNFRHLSSKDQFLEIGKKFMMAFLESPHYTPSAFVWFAAVKWIKRSDDRKVLFPKLLHRLRLEKYPTNFLNQVVHNEPLFRETYDWVSAKKSNLCRPPTQGIRAANVGSNHPVAQMGGNICGALKKQDRGTSKHEGNSVFNNMQDPTSIVDLTNDDEGCGSSAQPPKRWKPRLSWYVEADRPTAAKRETEQIAVVHNVQEKTSSIDLTNDIEGIEPPAQSPKRARLETPTKSEDVEVDRLTAAKREKAREQPIGDQREIACVILSSDEDPEIKTEQPLDLGESRRVGFEELINFAPDPSIKEDMDNILDDLANNNRIVCKSERPIKQAVLQDNRL